ncbi:M20/M25/M40 family metallo-hydrolase [Pseudacidobacterium ailaaui]|uniref:M20/M25/M40 family metallo-hydrolase n=1 Tax=Pseudacidobacterium ailaaui TaxID=1382359 RepID=UPI0005D2727C|nr:M20/M25/M40 family metallo-hydrolase [Pseudacidobacterium ailaaui]
MFDCCRRALPAFLLIASIPVFAADKTKSKAPVEDNTPSYDQPQPAIEKIDLTMYQRIREEGLQHSHVMEYASALTDDIGPRLTGSPNMAKANAWTRDQLAAMGCVNAHLEDWGEFGMGWQQLNTWVRMTSPDTAVLIAQATPWSPSTNGAVSGEAVYVNIQEEKDFDKYRGKLAGKIVFLGEMRDVPPVDKPLFERYSEKELEEIAQYPVSDREGRDMQARLRMYLQRYQLVDKIAQFLADEKALAVVRPSRDGKNGGGSGGTIFDDNGAALGRQPYLADHKVKVPVVVMAIENYGRVYRLLQAHVPVTIEMDVETKFTGEHEHGYDTIAEIPGTDPKLKDEIVMVGGHLDSWIAGTGATDNGAGSVVAMEVMRILKALDVHPRRTIRIALWSGEEEGLFGSRGYVKQHFGFAPPLEMPDQKALPEFLRKTGPLEIKPEQKLVSAYFNVDNGSGRIRGVYLQENAAVAPIFAQWIAPLKDLGVTTLSMRNTGGTDHLSFDAVGIPGFQFIQDDLDYESRTHHSNMDTYERLQAADLKQIATVEAIFVYNAAMREQMLPRKPLPHPELRDKQNAPIPDLFPGAVPPAKEQK